MSRKPTSNIISNSEQLFNTTDLSPTTLGIILPLNPRGKISINSVINPATMVENKNSKGCPIKILLDSSASISIVRKDVLHERHRNHKDKKNKWSTIEGTFNTTFVTDIILKLPE